MTFLLDLTRAGATGKVLIKIVAQALDDAWDKIEKSGSGFARPAYANATREEIAKHMIEVAGRGERDQHILAEDAVRFLAENYKC